MELQASRSRARVGPSGEPVLLLDQDRSRWDWMLVSRGLAALERAYGAGGALGPYTLQAAIAACHARARVGEDTDWERIVAFYDGLAQLMPSPVVELNRAVAVGMAFGPEAALELVDDLRAEPALRGYHLLPTVRGDLSRSSAGTKRRGWNSSAPPRSRRTRANGPCCSSGWRPARPGTAADQKEAFDVARQQERCHLQRRRIDRRRGGAGLRSRGGGPDQSNAPWPRAASGCRARTVRRSGTRRRARMTSRSSASACAWSKTEQSDTTAASNEPSLAGSAPRCHR